jgi:hypothetical protein
MKTNASSKSGNFGRDRYPGRFLGIVVGLIIILYTVSLMVEKLRF